MAAPRTGKGWWVSLAAILLTVSGIFSLEAGMAQAPSEQQAKLPTAPSTLIGAEVEAHGTHVTTTPAASVSGTVLDAGGALIPGAKVEVASIAHENSQTVLAGEDGTFHVNGLTPGERYVIHVSMEGATWSSGPIILRPGESMSLDDIRLKVGVSDSITVSASREQIATAQVQMETQQKMFGIVPNYYTVYDAGNSVPLTAKLKFELARKTSFNPVTIAGVMFVAGVKQAGKTPDYQMGWAGYGQRLGATATTGLADILIGGAILPSLLHQDPRYFYQGTGTTRSRLMHALSNAIVIRGDSGRNQFNYSSIGGDLATSALQLTYFPQSNRSAGDFAGQLALATTERTLNAVAQEFLFARFTTRAKFHADSGNADLMGPLAPRSSPVSIHTKE